MIDTYSVVRFPMLVSCLCCVVLVPKVGSAQLSIQDTAAPTVTAANAGWQIAGDPLLYDGNVYYPTGPEIFFDGAVMSRTGDYRGVPLYQDRTLEPYSIVYVPMGGNVMKPYERLRNGELPGTTGSRAPSFPEHFVSGGAPPSGPPEIVATPGPAETPLGTRGTATPSATDAALLRQVQPQRLESIPAPTGTGGVWIEYEGARWFLDGAAVAYSAPRFGPVGLYRTFPVYREKNGDASRIWVTVVPNGPVAPYSRR